MLAIYLGALVLGLAVIGVQAFAGHDADASGHDFGHGDHDAPAWALVASLRFWAFALMAFGLTGSLLTAFGLAGATAGAVISAVAGVVSGYVVASVIRRMTVRGPSSQILRGEVVGKLGRVLVPNAPGGRAKIRVEIKGAAQDYVALSEEALAEGDVVVVDGFEGGEVSVSRAPPELKPG